MNKSVVVVIIILALLLTICLLALPAILFTGIVTSNIFAYSSIILSLAFFLSALLILVIDGYKQEHYREYRFMPSSQFGMLSSLFMYIAIFVLIYATYGKSNVFEDYAKLAWAISGVMTLLSVIFIGISLGDAAKAK